MSKFSLALLQGMSYTAFLVGYRNVVKSKRQGRGLLGVGVDVGGYS